MVELERCLFVCTDLGADKKVLTLSGLRLGKVSRVTPRGIVSFPFAVKMCRPISAKSV